MPNFVLVYKGGAMGQTEAERQQIMAAWGQWFGALGQSVVDAGNPFGPSKTVTNGGLRDGGKSGLGGYSVVTAGDMDEALSLAKGCPAVTQGGGVEVGQLADLPDSVVSLLRAQVASA